MPLEYQSNFLFSRPLKAEQRPQIPSLLLCSLRAVNYPVPIYIKKVCVYRFTFYPVPEVPPFAFSRLPNLPPEDFMEPTYTFSFDSNV